MYWPSQLAAWHDLGTCPNRDSATFGVQGILPCWLELEATGFVGLSARTAVRFRADYDDLFTQRLFDEIRRPRARFLYRRQLILGALPKTIANRLQPDAT